MRAVVPLEAGARGWEEGWAGEEREAAAPGEGCTHSSRGQASDAVSRHRAGWLVALPG